MTSSCPTDMLARSDRVFVDNAQNDHLTWAVDMSLVPDTPTGLRACRPPPVVALADAGPPPATTCTSCESSSSRHPSPLFWLLTVVLLAAALM